MKLLLAIVAISHGGVDGVLLQRKPASQVHADLFQPKESNELKCTEALQQQIDSNKVNRVKAYNLMSPDLPIVKLTGFDNRPYTPFDIPVEPYSLLHKGSTIEHYRVPDSLKSCPHKMQKNIHFIWFGAFLPDWVATNIATTAGKNPKWTVMLWTTVQSTEALRKKLNSKLTTPNIIVKYTPDYMTTFINSKYINDFENPGSKSDFMRLEVVYKYGGIYLDTDTISLLPFDDFGSRFQWPFVVFDHGDYANLCNCAFGAEAGSKFLLYAIEAMAQNHFVGQLSCAGFTGAFVHYNQTAIQMISSDNMLHSVPGYVQVQKQTFTATWVAGKWNEYQQDPVALSAEYPPTGVRQDTEGILQNVTAELTRIRARLDNTASIKAKTVTPEKLLRDYAALDRELTKIGRMLRAEEFLSRPDFRAKAKSAQQRIRVLESKIRNARFAVEDQLHEAEAFLQISRATEGESRDHGSQRVASHH